MKRVGLLGYRAPTGIGYLCRRIARKMSCITKWLTPRHLADGDSAPLGIDRGVDVIDLPRAHGMTLCEEALERFLADIDWLLAVERELPVGLFERAKKRGIHVALIVMGEWLRPDVLEHVDLCIAPNRLCYETLVNLNRGRSSVLVPMPLDLEELYFIRRHHANNFLFCDGYGGVAERKGAAVIEKMILADPSLPLKIRSQRTSRFPQKGRLLPPVNNPVELYNTPPFPDVAIQPSKWEGLGLQILEAMACGLPVISSGGPPMCEYLTDAYGKYAHLLLIPCKTSRRMVSYLPWPESVIAWEDALGAVKTIQGRPIEELSVMGRDYIEKNHGNQQWSQLEALFA